MGPHDTKRHNLKPSESKSAGTVTATVDARLSALLARKTCQDYWLGGLHMSRFEDVTRTTTIVVMMVSWVIGLVSGAPAWAAGLDGSGYVQIAPTFNEGATGNTSYIRLSNDGSAKTTFTVKMVGSPSGTVYGTG